MKKALLLSVFMLNLAFANPRQEMQNILANYMAKHCAEFLHYESYQGGRACAIKLSNQCVNDDNSDSCLMGAVALMLGGKFDTAQVLAQRACRLDKKKCEFANVLRNRR